MSPGGETEIQHCARVANHLDKWPQGECFHRGHLKLRQKHRVVFVQSYPAVSCPQIWPVMICTKTKPNCGQCPVKTLCVANAQGVPQVLPKISRAVTRSVTIDRAWIENKNRLLLYLNSANAQQLAGQYELPSLESLGAKTPNETPLAIKTRAITNRRIKERIHSGESLSKQKLLFQSEHQWICLERMNSITLSGPHRRWVQEFLKKPRLTQ